MLVIANIVTNRLLPGWAYVPFDLAVTAVVVVLATQVVSLRDIGFAEWRRGLRWGAVVAGATLVVFLVAVAVPGLADLFEDRRVDDGVGDLLSNALLRIPLGTVVLEEVAFRGALPAVLAVRWPPLRAYAAASLLFGLWHVLPAWDIGDVNPVAEDVFGDGGAGRAAGIAFAVAGTFVAGLWLSFLRHRSGSLLAPTMAHVATNSLGYMFAWFVT